MVLGTPQPPCGQDSSSIPSLEAMRSDGYCYGCCCPAPCLLSSSASLLLIRRRISFAYAFSTFQIDKKRKPTLMFFNINWTKVGLTNILVAVRDVAHMKIYWWTDQRQQNNGNSVKHVQINQAWGGINEFIQQVWGQLAEGVSKNARIY